MAPISMVLFPLVLFLMSHQGFVPQSLPLFGALSFATSCLAMVMLLLLLLIHALVIDLQLLGYSNVGILHVVVFL